LILAIEAFMKQAYGLTLHVN